jgi:hypothetical protein
MRGPSRAAPIILVLFDYEIGLNNWVCVILFFIVRPLGEKKEKESITEKKRV